MSKLLSVVHEFHYLPCPVSLLSSPHRVCLLTLQPQKCLSAVLSPFVEESSRSSLEKLKAADVDTRQWVHVRGNESCQEGCCKISCISGARCLSSCKLWVLFLCVFCAGDRYVVVDCGGGTVDLTVHQIRLPEGHLKELYKASGKRTTQGGFALLSAHGLTLMKCLDQSQSPLFPGGPYGSIGIDYEFEKLLCKIFGQDFIDQFKIKRPAAWVDLMIAFESRKRAAAPERTNPLNINLPFSFIDYYKKFRGHSVEHALRKSK